jgi:O-antigen/teichoic acid export membrane protein
MFDIRKNIINGALWVFAERFLSTGVGIVTTLMLAWFLVPEDYALVAMLAVFITLSSVLVDAGFGEALIRRLEVSDLELNTVFWVNIVLAIGVYLIVFFLAPLIASFYGEPRLIDLIRVVSLAIFFQSLIVVQKSVLSRALKFKLQIKVVLPSAILSSSIAIFLGFFDYGVWSLIYQILANSVFQFVFYWLLKLWRPSFVFSMDAIKELWLFAKHIVIDSLVTVPFKNMYLIVLPIYFAAGPVGHYFFAQKAKELLIGLIVSSVQTVTYPALAQIQEDQIRLKQGYRKVVAITTFLMFPIMFFFATLAPVLFELALPEKWQGAAIYLQLMCLAVIFYPLNSINLNILKVKGRSDLVLYVGIVKKLITIGIFLYTLQFGIIEIIIGQIVASVINYLPNVYYSSKLIRYSIKEQLTDFLPSMILSSAVSGLIYYLQLSLSLSPIIELFSLMILAVALYLIGAYTLKLHGFELAQELFIKRFKKEAIIL